MDVGQTFRSSLQYFNKCPATFKTVCVITRDSPLLDLKYK